MRSAATDGGSDEQTATTTILSEAIGTAVDQLERPLDGLFLSGLSAGLDIGFGPLLMAVLLTLLGPDTISEPLTAVAMANAYTVGFLFVVLGRSELFTEHTTLAVLPLLDRRTSLSELGRLWATVYAANVVGGAGFALGGVFVAASFGAAEPAAFGEIGTKLVDHSAVGLAVGAVFAGWLMGLLAWLVAAAQETISRAVIVWLVTLTIALPGLPHCIAGNVEVVAGMVATGAVTVPEYARFMVLSTAGNTVGGVVFVALLKYGHVVRGSE